MKALANGQKAGRRRPKRASEEQAAAELEQLQTEDEEQDRDYAAQDELVASFAAERIHLEVQHRDRVLALETQHKVALAQLDVRQAKALVRLWEKQGRPLGPWAQRMIEGVKNGTPG